MNRSPSKTERSPPVRAPEPVGRIGGRLTAEYSRKENSTASAP
ncbi:hypothetical protein [Streptomyces sp. V4I8]